MVEKCDDLLALKVAVIVDILRIVDGLSVLFVVEDLFYDGQAIVELFSHLLVAGLDRQDLLLRLGLGL